MKISWSEASQLMVETITFLNERGVDTSKLSASNPDDLEKLAGMYADHSGCVWSTRDQRWIAYTAKSAARMKR